MVLGAEVPHAAVVEALGDRPARMPPLPLDPLAVERGPKLVGRPAVVFVGVAGAHDRRIQPDQPWLLLLMIRSARPTQGRRRCLAPPRTPASCPDLVAVTFIRLQVGRRDVVAAVDRIQAAGGEERRAVLRGERIKEPFGQALTYLRNQLDHLLVYLDDGLMPIDNNETEQLMKQVALGRKNWMFIGSVAAGYRAADLMMLVSSAARNDLDVFMYVKDVLDRLLAGESNYDVLRPDLWKQSHPEAIRIYRQEERRSRADAKAIKRALRRIAPKA